MSIRYSKWHLSQSSLSTALIYFKSLVDTIAPVRNASGFFVYVELLVTADGTAPQYGCGLKC